MRSETTSERPPSCVLLADGHQGLTEAVRKLLEPSFGTVIMVADEASLIDGARRVQPDVVIVDLGLVRRASMDWVGALRRNCPVTRLIVLTVHDEAAVRRAALEAGADDVVLVRAVATDLLPAVARSRRAFAG